MCGGSDTPDPVAPPPPAPPVKEIDVPELGDDDVRNKSQERTTKEQKRKGKQGLMITLGGISNSGSAGQGLQVK